MNAIVELNRVAGANGENACTAGVETPRSLRAGMMAATCIASVFHIGEAGAQQINNQLPALTVEAPAVVRPERPAREAQRPVRQVRSRPAQRPMRSAQPATAPASAAGDQGATGVPSAPGQTTAGASLAPGGNPYANPDAPYQVQRSSSHKLTEPLINTPRTVVAIPKEVIEDKGATSFRELMRTTPGVTLGTGEGGNAYGDRVFVRGFDTRNDMYVDGVRDPGVGVRETFQYEQVEILKGPSSTVGGRGATGGAINLVTKKPFFQNYHEAEIAVGTDRTRRVTFDVKRVVTDTVAIRAVGMGQLAGVAGRDVVTDNRWGGLFGVTWKPSSTFKVSLDYQHVEMDQIPDWGIPTDPRTKMPLTESGLRRNTFYGYRDRDFLRAKQDIFSGSAEWNITDWMTLSSKLRQGRSTLDYVVSAPEAPNFTDPDPSQWTVRSSPKSRHQITNVTVNQTDLTIRVPTFALMHTIVAGVELSREEIMRGSYQNLASEMGGGTAQTNIAGEIVNVWNPVVSPFTGSLVLNAAYSTVRIDTRSAYVLDTINWADRLFITGGVRFDDYSVAAANHAANGAITPLASHSGLWNTNAGVTYKILPTWAIYAAYGTSSNPVGAEFDGTGSDYGGLVATNATLAPERNTSKEVGTKVELFDRRLLATATFFQTTKTHAREASGTGAAATILATAAYKVSGFEFSLAGKVTDTLSLSGGVVVMDTEATRSINPANVGLKLANIAHHSFNLLAKYQLTQQFSLGGQVTVKDKLRGGTLVANTGTVAPGGRARLDVFAEYEIMKDVTAKLAIYNLTNAVIYDAFYRSAAPFVYLAPGRSATASLKFKF